jgi:uncharacterized membrane protein
MNTFWHIILGVHLLSMAFFVGGQLFLAAIVVPVLRGVDEGQRMRLAARRFAHGTAGAILLLVITGSMMASHFDKWSDSTLQIKLGLLVAVLALIGAHAKWPKNHALEPAIFVLSLGIVWCGIVIAN